MKFQCKEKDKGKGKCEKNHQNRNDMVEKREAIIERNCATPLTAE
jgi:hypothetical protein